MNGKLSATACVLVYGDHPRIAERFFRQWRRCGQGIPLRVGMNACGVRTEGIVERAMSEDRMIRRLGMDGNTGKAVTMRRLFREPGIETEWTIWFDDDSFPFRADWLASLEIAVAAQPGAAILGIPASVGVDEAGRRWIEEAPWYRGMPLLAADRPGCVGRMDFVLGGFWAIRSAWIWRLDWPDRRLVHFGDDYFLGEAIRQNGGGLGRFRSGVRVDTEPRRAPPGLFGSPGVQVERRPGSDDSPRR